MAAEGHSQWRWFPWVVMVLVAIAGLLPGEWIAETVPCSWLAPGRDKIGHAVGFMLLTLTFRFWRGRGAAPAEWIPGSVLILTGFALSHEYSQRWIPGRTPDGEDLVADLLGIAVGILLAVWLLPPKGTKSA
ncbi:MAG TPA: VanZ family protein [Planctomycetes bacterium]|nr:VanZ family protein [Planctomycetota bacterium]HIK83097.1 VanZ family protein [Planctomycetota bacterium]